VYWTPTAWLSSVAVTMVQASTVLPGDPADAAGAVAAAAAAAADADAPPAAAALVDELLEQAVKPSRHRPAPAATSGMFWRIDRLVMRTTKTAGGNGCVMGT
jgi:hypothetical protein